IYQVVVQNGVSCPYDTSSIATFTIDAQTAGGLVGSDTTVCYQSNGDTLSLTNYIGSIVSWIYSIDNGISWTSINNATINYVYNNLTQTTLFSAVVKSGVCSIDTSTAAEVNVVSLPLVSAGADIVIIQGQSSILNGSGNGSPLWSPSIGLSSDSLFSPILTTTITTQYILVVIDTNGCVNSDSVLVTVLPPTFSGTISNLFTPNNDGINDTWYIENIHLFPKSDVLVYNIYGNKVYEKTGYMNDWAGTYNGAPLPDGTYYYVLTVEGESGTETYKGSVDILKNK
ncbi:MAG TPA: gliding motility-associated C-terminal domain-containing protein, partial [Bacteroidia bacterium]|nr:gliding motility-associated C-terminal domain-containing protein [Bacteroidia bacterium]